MHCTMIDFLGWKVLSRSSTRYKYLSVGTLAVEVMQLAWLLGH
jgi:hypothetical protein